jgi:phospholipid/cholesterol/gamma-HCH transport system substrate-binding protein
MRLTMPTEKKRASQVKVGLFLLAGIAMVLATLFVIGQVQRPFARRVYLHTSFRDTGGLTVGAPVRLGGVDVGNVQEIRFAPALEVKEVSVTLGVQSRYLARIRADSRATLTPKGLLGDLTVTITVGSAAAAPLQDGAFIPAIESQGLADMVSSLQEGISDVRSFSRTLGDRVDAVLSPDVASDLARFVRAAADGAEAVQRGDGLAHALIYDQALAADGRALVRGARRSADNLEAALGRLDRLATAVESGGGNLHRLVYGDDLGPMLDDAERAARALANAATEIRNGSGPLHGLVYGHDGDELLRNLTLLSRNLRRVSDDVAAGKGTLGALLEDPTVYEDLKIILRDVKRNTLLKALVRYTIQRDRLRQGDRGSVTVH